MDPDSGKKTLPKDNGGKIVYGSGKSSFSSKEAKIDRDLADYIDLAKNYDLKQYFKKDFYLDVRDEFKYCTAQIIAIDASNETMTVHFDNWSNKYDENLRFTSKKVLPIRFSSRSYTGQSKCTLREFDSGLTRKDEIVGRMEGYAKSEFKCINAQEIQEMYQFLCGECYLYLDSLLTCDEKDAKAEANSIIETINVFFDMLKVWIELVPKYSTYYSSLRQYPYLYLVCPEAAVLNLSKSFVVTLELIFGKSPRSVDFFRSSSSSLPYDKETMPKKKGKGVSTTKIYFLEGFINTKCLSSLKTQWLINEDQAPIDFSTVLGFLLAIAPIFSSVEHTSEEAIEFLGAVHQYVFQDEGGISQKVISLPESEIKDLDENEVIKVAEAYGPLTGYSKTSKGSSQISEIKLEILIIFLRSPFIKKKLYALNEMKTYLNKKDASAREPDISEDELNLAMKAIDYIFKEAKHPELISRSTDVLLIIANHGKLDKETIELLCDTSLNEHKHEAIAGATLSVISDIAKECPIDIILVFFEEIQKLTIEMIDENLVTFLKNFYFNCLINFKRLKYKQQISTKKISELINLEMFWEVIQDECHLPNKVKEMALDALVEMMIALSLSNTSDYLQKAVDSLKEGHSSLKCITLIEKVLKNISSRRDYPPVLKSKRDDLIMLTFHAVEIYLKNARSNIPMDGSKIEDTKFSGNVTHKEFIKKVFGFISYLLKSYEAFNKLTNEHIDMMYQVFVRESISSIERKEFYNFFTYDEFDTTASQDRRLVSPKTKEYLFEKILCKELTSENTGISEFK